MCSHVAETCFWPSAVKTCVICDLTPGWSESREPVMASGCVITGGRVVVFNFMFCFECFVCVNFHHRMCPFEKESLLLIYGCILRCGPWSTASQILNPAADHRCVSLPATSPLSPSNKRHKKPLFPMGGTVLFKEMLLHFGKGLAGCLATLLWWQDSRKSLLPAAPPCKNHNFHFLHFGFAQIKQTRCVD